MATEFTPLWLYWHAGRGDYFSTSTAQGIQDAQNAGYWRMAHEGWVSPTSRSGWVPLKLYWHPQRGDNFSTATRQGEQDALDGGYGFVRYEGWVLPSRPSTTGPVVESALILYWNPELEDNFTTATRHADAQNAGYQRIRTEGYVRLYS